MSMHQPMLAAMHESIAEATAAVQAGDANETVFRLLDAFAALGRHRRPGFVDAPSRRSGLR